MICFVNNNIRGDIMKMSMFEMAMVASLMTILGYSYMKKNPEMVCKAKKAVKDTSKMIYTKLDKLENED